MSARPTCVLLLPRRLEGFILRDQAEDLLRSDDVVALAPPRWRYGLFSRLPGWLGKPLARAHAGRQAKILSRAGRTPAVVAIFHPLQLPVAEALIARTGGTAELWYGRWDRYEAAYDAAPKLRAQLAGLHERAAARSALTFVASVELERQERDTGREAQLVTLAADSFPAPEPAGTVIAVSLGHLGWRTDWALLRAVAERMPELVLMLIGRWHDDEVGADPDYAWCRAHPGFVWLGARSDEEAARLILCADAGIVPFKVEPFNDAGLPYRILKYARLGRRTITPELAGVRTWERAVTTAAGADAFADALRAERGRRTAAHDDIREWALAHTAQAVNAPLWERLSALGLAGDEAR